MLKERPSIDAAIRAVVFLLLLVAIWRIEAVNDAIKERPMGSGQTITQFDITTERWIGEDLEDWAKRHMEAIRKGRSIREESED